MPKKIKKKALKKTKVKKAKVFKSNRTSSKFKWVYNFEDTPRLNTQSLKNLLGGKGANLSEMIRIKLPVPPGFTITTEACNEYYNLKKKYRNNKLSGFELLPSLIKVAKKNLPKSVNVHKVDITKRIGNL